MHPCPVSSKSTRMIHGQREFQLRFEWGPRGIEHLASISDSVVIVDVLTFSTAVVVAAARGATVFPYRWNDDGAADYARSVDALLAGPRGESKHSLSPQSPYGFPVCGNCLAASSKVRTASNGSLPAAATFRAL